MGSYESGNGGLVNLSALRPLARPLSAAASVAIVSATLTTALITLAALSRSHVESGVVVAASAALPLVFLIPTRRLPGASLLTFVLFPMDRFSDTFGRFLALPVLLLFVWCIKAPVARRGELREPFTLTVCTFIVISLALSLAFGGGHLSRELAWAFDALVCFVFVPLVASSHENANEVWPFLRDCYFALTVVVGLMALVEIGTGFNPWLHLYSSAIVDMKWNVPRAKGPFGHPLGISLFESAGVILALFDTTQRTSVRRRVVLFGILGIVCSVSRSSLFTLAIPVLVAVFMPSKHSLSRNIAWKGPATAIGMMVVLVGLYLSPALQARSSSSGGQLSAENRTSNFSNAVHLGLHYLPFGSGPGTSVEIFPNIYGSALENSALEVFVSLGIGSLLIAFIIGSRIFRPLRSKGRAQALSLLSCTIGLIAYNIVDVSPKYLVLPAFLIIGTFVRTDLIQPAVAEYISKPAVFACPGKNGL